MAAAAVAFLAGRRTDALTLRGQLQAVEAQAMLDAALQQTVVLLANRQPRQVVPAQLSWRFGEVAVQVRFERETGKIDLNAAEDRMLRALPLALGLDEDRAAALADAIQDWRDDNQLKLELGAEDRDYRGESSAASVRRTGPFANPAELLYLPSVDRAAWALLQPYVTDLLGRGGTRCPAGCRPRPPGDRDRAWPAAGRAGRRREASSGATQTGDRRRKRVGRRRRHASEGAGGLKGQAGGGEHPVAARYGAERDSRRGRTWRYRLGR